MRSRQGHKGRPGEVLLGQREAAGKANFLAHCKLELQVADGFQLAAAGKATDIDGLDAPAAMAAASVSFASGSSPAMSTVVGCEPTVLVTRDPAKVVLNAFSTFESGSAVASCAAAELSAGTASWNAWKSTGFVMSRTILPAIAPPTLSDPKIVTEVMLVLPMAH
jgi:hypothetical protein